MTWHSWLNLKWYKYFIVKLPVREVFLQHSVHWVQHWVHSVLSLSRAEKEALIIHKNNERTWKTFKRKITIKIAIFSIGNCALHAHSSRYTSGRFTDPSGRFFRNLSVLYWTQKMKQFVTLLTRGRGEPNFFPLGRHNFFIEISCKI